MAASRLKLKTGKILVAGSSLLAVIFFTRCGPYREYVRRGEVLDSISVRLERIERKQASQDEEIARFRADALTGIEKLDDHIAELDAELVDISERLERIGRRTGAWRGELITESAPSAESAVSPVDTTIAGIDADRLYNTAYLDFTKGDYQVAITGFRRFIQLFPSSDMADNAQYWVGECFYSLNQLDSAELELQRVISQYPEGNKIPAAMYKLGLIYQLQGKGGAAERQFRAVIEKYPNTPEAKLAEERLKSTR
jgi:tol-pal system protein YbgF